MEDERVMEVVEEEEEREEEEEDEKEKEGRQREIIFHSLERSGPIDVLVEG
jgi:hypothetical protein